MYLWKYISVLLFNLYFLSYNFNSGSVVMFPLDSNLDTFSLCREACRGAIVPWCRGEWYCGAVVPATFLVCLVPCDVLFLCFTRAAFMSIIAAMLYVVFWCEDCAEQNVSRTQDIISNFAFLLHKLSPSSDTTPFVTALDIASMSCVVLVILEHTL